MNILALLFAFFTFMLMHVNGAPGNKALLTAIGQPNEVRRPVRELAESAEPKEALEGSETAYYPIYYYPHHYPVHYPVVYIGR